MLYHCPSPIRSHPALLKNLFRSLRSGRPARTDDPGFIDVQRLIRELSDEELLRGADAYFAKMSLASEQCRKPFSNPSDAVHLTRHLGLLLEADNKELTAKESILKIDTKNTGVARGLTQIIYQIAVAAKVALVL
jgi:hypothetical protein